MKFTQVNSLFALALIFYKKKILYQIPLQRIRENFSSELVRQNRDAE